MEIVSFLVPVSIGGLAAYLLLRRLGSTPAPRSWVPIDGLPLEEVAPGDVVAFWELGERIVETVLCCTEEVNGRQIRWRLIFFDTGEVVELAPRGAALYTQCAVIRQGSSEFDRLTSDLARGGALQTFEARVRARTLAGNPVEVDLGGARYRITSTGTFRAGVWGAALTRSGWRDLSDDPAENVYFTLEGRPASAAALGIWTSHIVLLQGRPLQDGEIRTVYPRIE